MLHCARRELLLRCNGDHWEGRLASSALATATAVVALDLVEQETRSASASNFHKLIASGLRWLVQHQNADGGWGDTTSSPSNISTSVLCWAACRRLGEADVQRRAADAAERWLEAAVGSLSPERLSEVIASRYGQDRTFSVPILMTCALTGRLGADPWRWVLQLPFELAACPHQWFRWLQLPVVSYALPALVAIGQLRHTRRPSRNPATRLLRDLTRARTMRLLERSQPASGGFLEAVPLTSFVVMALAGAGHPNHPVAAAGTRFLAASARADGSWPIDTNLATWVTTLAVDALAGGRSSQPLAPDERRRLLDWLLAQQWTDEHPYTHAEPGGWAWTNLPGGVPDADDTAGALLALGHLGDGDERATRAAEAAVRWLLSLQNADGGMPTFCRGWGRLPFDRSGADLTAHAIRAWAAWRSWLPAATPAIDRASVRAVEYLRKTQRSDGAWVPLWFGHQGAPAEQNLTYGTSRVLPALFVTSDDEPARGQMAAAGRDWLLGAQNPDGGWGGSIDVLSSIEETGLAISALAGLPQKNDRVSAAIGRGLSWLADSTDRGRRFTPTPIGLYFARLWYSEELYPLIFAVSALERAHRNGL